MKSYSLSSELIESLLPNDVPREDYDRSEEAFAFVDVLHHRAKPRRLRASSRRRECFAENRSVVAVEWRCQASVKAGEEAAAEAGGRHEGYMQWEREEKWSFFLLLLGEEGAD